MLPKLYIDSSSIGKVICPACKLSRTVDMAKYVKSNAAVKVKCQCKCGHTSVRLLERRRYFRKSTELSGAFFDAEHKVHGSMIVTDLSRTGVKIEIQQKNCPVFLSPGAKLALKFNLEDRTHSLVNQKVIIRSAEGHYFGGEFLFKIKDYKLDAYILSPICINDAQ